MRVWIDIDNPPQVQYLSPFERAFTALGADVVVTARDYGDALELLRVRGVQHHALGHRFPRSRAKKAIGSLRRARALLALFARVGRPDVLLCASRSSAVAARLLGIPSFVVADYEYANVSAYRMTGSTFLYPDAIDPRAFLERGLRDHQLVPFAGLKEDVSFDGIDIESVPAWQPPTGNGGVRVLYRPPRRP
jgi:predicted glycosyltransferase